MGPAGAAKAIMARMGRTSAGRAQGKGGMGEGEGEVRATAGRVGDGGSKNVCSERRVDDKNARTTKNREEKHTLI